MSVDAAALFALEAGVVQAIEALLAGSLGGEVDRACVVPGVVAGWDDCECGLLMVNHRQMWPTQAFPLPVERERANCAVPFWAVTVVVTLLRCSPQGTDDDGPTCEQLEEAARVLAHDQQMVQRGIACALADQKYRIQDHTPIGPAGACVGSELIVIVAVPDCPDDC